MLLGSLLLLLFSFSFLSSSSFATLHSKLYKMPCIIVAIFCVAEPFGSCCYLSYFRSYFGELYSFYVSLFASTCVSLNVCRRYRRRLFSVYCLLCIFLYKVIASERKCARLTSTLALCMPTELNFSVCCSWTRKKAFFFFLYFSFLVYCLPLICPYIYFYTKRMIDTHALSED